MVDIRVSPEQLRSVAASLDGQSQEIANVLRSIVATVDGLQSEWTGLAQVDYAQTFHDRVPPMQSRLAETMEHLINDLRHIADEFERADQQAVGDATPSSMGIAAAIGAAVGAGTITNALAGMTQLPITGESGISQAEYNNMMWRQRWDKRDDLAEITRRAQQALDQWNNEHADEISDLTLEQVEEYLKHLDKLEADAEQNIYDMQHPDGFLDWLSNQISDADEQYIAVNEDMLQRIREEWRPRWEERQDLLLEQQTLKQQLDQAKQNQVHFDDMLRADIPPQSGNLDRVAGCVNYVMEDSYVPWDNRTGELNASNWLNLAQEKQYQDMGVTIHDTPQPGDVIWFEPGSGDLYPISGAGHVAVVDRIDPNTGEFVYREASTHYRNGGFGLGYYINPGEHDPTTMNKLNAAGYNVKFIHLPWADLY